MKRLLIYASLKGGVGKSFGARVFLDTARRAGRTVSAWDLDGNTGSLAILYPDRDPLVGVAIEDVRDPRCVGAWLEALYGDADDVLLDVPGGAFDDLLRVLEGGAASLVSEAKSSERELVLVSVIGTKKDSTPTPLDMIERFGVNDVHHVVLKNGFFGEPNAFLIYDGIRDVNGIVVEYGKAAPRVAAAGGEVVYLPKLNGEADTLLDAKALTFQVGSTAIEVLGRRHAANVRLWLGNAASAMAGTWLDPFGSVPNEATAVARGRSKVAVPA